MFALRNKKLFFDGKPQMTKTFEFENLNIPQNGLSPKPSFSRPKFFFAKKRFGREK